MKWTVKIVAEAGFGELVEEEVVTIEREDLITPACRNSLISRILSTGCRV
jgi:hypothetical protein